MNTNTERNQRMRNIFHHTHSSSFFLLPSLVHSTVEKDHLVIQTFLMRIDDESKADKDRNQHDFASQLLVLPKLKMIYCINAVFSHI